jgi:nucleotide-binding universal stress UspA family protein
MTDVRRILVPVDFSVCSQAALEYAAFFAGSLHASLDLLHVWDPQRDFARSDAGLAMQVCLAGLEDEGIWARGLFEMSEDPAAAILSIAACDYELVVLGTHGDGERPDLLLGSVAEEIVRRAPCPVVTVSDIDGTAHVRPAALYDSDTRRPG